MASHNSAWPEPIEDLVEPQWDRQPGETDPAWSAFQQFRDTPHVARSYEQVAKAMGRHHMLLARWGAQYRWQERVRAWDRERDRAFAQGQLVEITRMGQRHAARAATAIEAMMVPLQVVASRMHDPLSMEQLARMPFPDLLKLASQTVRPLAALVAVERLSRGEPTAIERTEVIASEGETPAPKLSEVVEILRELGVVDTPSRNWPPKRLHSAR